MIFSSETWRQCCWVGLFSVGSGSGSNSDTGSWCTKSMRNFCSSNFKLHKTRILYCKGKKKKKKRVLIKFFPFFSQPFSGWAGVVIKFRLLNFELKLIINTTVTYNVKNMKKEWKSFKYCIGNSLILTVCSRAALLFYSRAVYSDSTWSKYFYNWSKYVRIFSSNHAQPSCKLENYAFKKYVCKEKTRSNYKIYLN